MDVGVFDALVTADHPQPGGHGNTEFQTEDSYVFIENGIRGIFQRINQPML